MKQVSAATTNAWLSGDYTGPQKPVMRATIQRPQALNTAYQVPLSTTTTWAHEGQLRSLLFNQTGPIRELPNIMSIKWDRNQGQDTATCEIVLLNSAYHDQSSDPGALDEPGYLTPNRGVDDFFTSWGYPTNEWEGWIEPDRIIRTYEGYGTSGAADPAADTNLYPSGVWRIDDVTLDTDGKITLACRDISSILIDQVHYPPAVPFGAYPLWFEQFGTNPAPYVYTTTTQWKAPLHMANSNTAWLGGGYLDGRNPAVGANGVVYGHNPADVTSYKLDHFWLTPGSRQPEWSYLDFTVDSNDTVGALQIQTHGGPYMLWVSIKVGGHWQGVKKIPYQQTHDTPNLSANLPYVASATTGKLGQAVRIKLPKKYAKVQQVRLTVRSGWYSHFGVTRHYRTAINGLRVCEDVTVTTGGPVPIGNISDYSSIVEWICGWAGLHQPQGSTLETMSGSSTVPNSAAIALPTGNIFGHLTKTGTAPTSRIGIQTFDQQPFMDGIKYAIEATGFSFGIDEWGGVVWRLPNIFIKGNWVAGANGGAYTRSATAVTELHDDQVLTQVSVKMSNADVREQIFVADLDAKYGATVAGYNPAPTGLNRVAGLTDFRLQDSAHCLVMADLMAIKLFYRYRQNNITIAANPAIQIDDQIVIKDRITGEGYLHHVTGLSSQWQAADGKWLYTITTEWLGSASSYSLGFDPTQMDNLTKQYLKNLGAV